MTGSSIFSADAENGALESDANTTPSNKTGLRMYQVYNKSSRILKRMTSLGSLSLFCCRITMKTVFCIVIHLLLF